MSRLLVIGSINLDLVLETDSLPAPGETVLGGTFLRVNGGKGANQAVAAARGGTADVSLLAAVGDDDLGSRVQRDLESELRLDVSLVRRKTGLATGVAAILVDRHAENMICVAPGANAALSVADVEALPEDLFARSSVMLASLEVPLDTVHAALCRGKEKGATIILNPAPVVAGLADHQLLNLVDILTPNEHEATQLSAIEVHDRSSALQAARAISGRYSIDRVVVTMGASGVVVVEKERDYDVPAEMVKACDTTAAGDCFNGVLATQLAAGVDFAEAVRLAVKGASLSVTRRGAQSSLPYLSEFCTE